MTIAELEHVVDEMAHWLPAQGPVKEFIHHNTLHSFQSWPFLEGCLRAARLYGSRAFLPLHDYRELFLQGQISLAYLGQAVLEEVGEEADVTELEEKLLREPALDETLTKGVSRTSLRSRWRDRKMLPLHVRTHAILFRLVGQFLDQGVAMWRMPHADRCSLFEAVGRIVKESWFSLTPYSWPDIRPWLDQPPAEVVLQILQRFVGEEKYFGRYLLELSLGHPGWSGLVRQIEMQPTSLVARRKISLMEFLALELMAEYAFVVQSLGKDFKPLLEPGEILPPLPTEDDYQLELTETEKLQKIWHKAYEQTYHLRVLNMVSQHRGRGKVTGAAVQAFFCIDDRECSLRRHLELVWPAVQTFGTAGFFGLDCVFQGVNDAFPFKHCPVPLTPKYKIYEVGGNQGHHPLFEGADAPSGSNSLMRGFLISQTLGLWSSVKLAYSIFRPSMGPLTASSLRRVDQNAELKVLRTQEEPEDGYFVGYNDEEMATRVANLLRATGAISAGLAELIVFIGHGASSVNNPYFAAYDCGACSGKPGAPNARAFALMANRPEVRRLLAEKGIEIPEQTWFVGALHDTTRDEVQYYELDLLPERLREKFQKFRNDLETALALNAQERCRKFALVSKDVTPAEALEEVRRRSTAIFEPRPELNHATNVGAIVGQRALTRGLNLDRRVFLNSYDPALDPEGEILAGILGAVVPVCGGINLEYYFSRLDPKVYGAGSKLPHNVNGLIGVMNGTEGDLLTGLPSQMTEIHDPIRLMLLVQQEPDIALRAIQKNPAIYEWVQNQWLHYYCVARTFDIFQYKKGIMEKVNLAGTAQKLPVGAALIPDELLATS